MIFLIDNVDFSGSVQYTERSETPRKVYGNNGMTAIDGTEIVDLVATKHDLKVVIRPMQSEQLAALAGAIASAYVDLTYFSALDNAEVTRRMIPEMGSVALALRKIATGEIFYNGAELNFREA